MRYDNIIYDEQLSYTALRYMSGNVCIKTKVLYQRQVDIHGDEAHATVYTNYPMGFHDCKLPLPRIYNEV